MAIKRSDGIETKQKLLEAAGEIFADKGFRDATVADICRAAGANVAAVNYYFDSKDKLYVEAWRHAFTQSVAAFPPDGGVQSTAPAKERLHGRIVAIMHRVLDPASRDFDIVHLEMANPTGLLSEVIHQHLAPMRKTFLDIVQELLGPDAEDQQAQLCEMSIRSQCLGPLIRERHRKKHKAPLGPPPLTTEVNVLAEHVFHFSMAGINYNKRLSKTRKAKSKARKTPL